MPALLQVKAVSLLGLVHTLGNLLTNMSLGAVAVSFTHTIKVTFGAHTVHNLCVHMVMLVSVHRKRHSCTTRTHLEVVVLQSSGTPHGRMRPLLYSETGLANSKLRG